MILSVFVDKMGILSAMVVVKEGLKVPSPSIIPQAEIEAEK